MTEQKSLKRRVRERMARTGESYTTARRNVVARAGTPGAAGSEDGPHRPSRLTRRLLAAHGLDVTEPTACGLGGGVGFMYAVFEYREVPHPLLTVVAQHHPTPWPVAVAENLGVDAVTAHSSAVRPALGKLDRQLDGGTPAWLTVARGLLPGQEAGDPWEAADPYPVLAVDRTPAGYLLAEGRTAQEVSADDLAAAWAGHRPGRFELVTLPALPPGGNEEQLAAGVRRAVRMTARHLTGPVLGNSFDVNFGLSGMHKLATELRDARTKKGWTRRFATPEHARYACARLAECLTSAYTAPGGTRPLYAAFLAEAADRLDDPGLGRASELFAESGRGWSDLAERAGTAADAERVDVPALFGDLADRVDRCADLERAAVDQMTSSQM